MANRDQPKPPAAPNMIERAIKKQKDELEKSASEGTPASHADTAPAPPLTETETSSELERYRDQLRNHEKALVDRIADVDDDRRATESRLQRAWQTQREEIDERLRRHAMLVAGLLILFAILFAIALLVVYRQVTSEQSDFTAEVSELRQSLAQSPGDATIGEGARDKLEELGTRVEEMTSSLGRLAEDGEKATQASIAAERADRTQSEGTLAEEIRDLGTEQARLAEALGSLRSVVQTLEAARAAEPTAADAVATDKSHVSETAAPVSTADTAPVKSAANAEVGKATDNGGDAAPAKQESDDGSSAPKDMLVAAGGNYALQLIGFFDRKSLDQFVVREGLPAQVYSIRRTYKERPWYVVIHSLHADYAKAEQELSRLPPDLAALNPWIRPLSEGTELQIIKTGPKRQ